MEIIRIFEDIIEEESLLWAVKYPGNEEGEYDLLFELWNDPEYLEQFFTEHFEDLNTEFWEYMSVEEAINKAMSEANDFEDMIYELAHGNAWKGKKNITEIFKTLVRQDFDSRNKQKYKSKPELKIPFLRLYAIRLEDDTYIITGGAIKLTEQMDGQKHLELEKLKMEQVKYFLKSNGISYLEDLTTE